MDMASTNPPQIARHPLNLLEYYLDYRTQQSDSELVAATAISAGSNTNPEIQIDPSDDDANAKATQEEVLRVADFLYGSTLDGALGLLDTPESINQVVSIPSERSLYLVRGQGDNSYFCLLSNNNNKSCEQVPVYYCSCRSFLEKSRNSNTHGAACLCKHLLALQLMKVLHVKGSVVSTVSDEEFGNLILSRIASR
jgi:hypothetical protein